MLRLTQDGGNMRTTVTLDDDLLARARELSGVEQLGLLLKKALTELVQREAGIRLARLGGTMPDLQDIPRRRPK